ncbi:MAG: hypothetical protein ACLP1X_13015 [Polyangiaceae bacterium]|jgi:hypothetical protein
MGSRVPGLAFVRTTLSLGDSTLRAAYVASALRAWPLEVSARVLDSVCERAEQAEAASRETLIAIVDALNGEGMADLLQRLREQAAGESLLALARLIRHPVDSIPPSGADARRDRVPDLGRGRELTLGERKSLARRADRDLMQRLLADPHPDVIRRCLGNPRVTEDDVVRLAAKRPCRGDVLIEIARSTWTHRPRVRLAVVMNPSTPVEMALRIAGLLLRPELALVAGSPGVSSALRALCIEYLERRPPVGASHGDPPAPLH